MIRSVQLDSVEAVGLRAGSSGAKCRTYFGLFVDEGAMRVEKVRAQRSLVLKVKGRVDVAIPWSRIALERAEIDAVGAYLEIVPLKVLLPRGAPVRSAAADVVLEVRSGDWDGTARTFRAIDTEICVEMVRQEAGAADSGDIATESSVDYGRCDGGEGGRA